MSHFSQTLDDMLKSSEPKLTQAELSARSGVDKTLISRFLSGNKTPDEGQVAKLCGGISNDREDRVKLLVAYLRDMAEPSFSTAGFDSRHLIIRSAEETQNKDSGESKWWENAPIGLVCKLESLGRGALASPPVEALLDAWVNQLSSHSQTNSKVINFPSVEKKAEKAKPGRTGSAPSIPAPKSTG